MNLKISIITPVFNQRTSIVSCIESVLSQNHSEFELIVSDYGSGDGTCALLRQKYQNTKCIKVLDESRSQFEAIKHGIESASGDVLCLFGADDMMADAGTLAKVNEVFEIPGVNLVYGKSRLFNNNDLLNNIFSKRQNKMHNASLPYGQIPLHTSIYIHRTLLNAVGYFSGKMHFSSEYELYLKLFMQAKSRPHYLDEYLLSKQQHTEKPIKKSRQNTKQSPSFYRYITNIW